MLQRGSETLEPCRHGRLSTFVSCATVMNLRYLAFPAGRNAQSTVSFIAVQTTIHLSSLYLLKALTAFRLPI